MSKVFYKSIMVCRYRLRDKIWNKRVFITGGILIMFLYLTEEGLLEYARYNDLEITPFVFPFVSGDWICQMIISGYFLWLISDLCSQKEADMFIYMRAGRIAWKLGNCISIWVCAISYTVMLMIASAVVLLPKLDFSVEWGSFWNTLAKTDAVLKNHIQVYVAPIVLYLYEPLEAMLRSACLQILCLLWLAFLMYFLNDLFGKAVGIYTSAAFIFLDVMLSNTFQEKFYRLSPITLVQLGNYSAATEKYGLNFQYALCFFLIGIFGFSIFILLNRKCRRRYGGK